MRRGGRPRSKGALRNDARHGNWPSRPSRLGRLQAPAGSHLWDRMRHQTDAEDVAARISHRARDSPGPQPGSFWGGEGKCRRLHPQVRRLSSNGSPHPYPAATPCAQEGCRRVGHGFDQDRSGVPAAGNSPRRRASKLHQRKQRPYRAAHHIQRSRLEAISDPAARTYRPAHIWPKPLPYPASSSSPDAITGTGSPRTSGILCMASRVRLKLPYSAGVATACSPSTAVRRPDSFPSTSALTPAGRTSTRRLRRYLADGQHHPCGRVHAPSPHKVASAQVVDAAAG